jgi:hypothetical protein
MFLPPDSPARGYAGFSLFYSAGWQLAMNSTYYYLQVNLAIFFKVSNSHHL